MTHAAVEPRNNRTRLIIIIAAVAVVVGLIAFALFRPQSPGAANTASPTPTNSATMLVSPLGSMPAAPAPSASVDPRLAGCTAVTEEFVPNRYTIERFGVDETIVALDLDADGNIAAPPLDEARMASWWSGGPKISAVRGKAIMSIHTYRTGKALGNELYADGASQFQAGDIMKVYGSEGQVQCYEYTGDEKVFVKDYDPDSNVMIDYEGSPSLAIIICWDFDPDTEDWDSRVFFNFVPINPPAA